MNMYAALEVLEDPSQRQLADTTWNQVVFGHSQATAALRWLITHAEEPAIRTSAQSTLADMNTYYGFTLRMHAAAQARRFVEAVRLVTVNPATHPVLGDGP